MLYVLKTYCTQQLLPCSTWLPSGIISGGDDDNMHLPCSIRRVNVDVDVSAPAQGLSGLCYSIMHSVCCSVSLVPLHCCCSCLDCVACQVGAGRQPATMSRRPRPPDSATRPLRASSSCEWQQAMLYSAAIFSPSLIRRGLSLAAAAVEQQQQGSKKYSSNSLGTASLCACCQCKYTAPSELQFPNN